MVGDNGIITQAQSATYATSMAVLEEWINQLYVENYDTIEDGDYESKVVALVELYSSYFYIPANDTNIGGSMRYVVDSEGHALYLINKSGLPSDIKSQIAGGEAGDGSYSNYASLIDVYGVTSDLKVYYCSNGTDTILGITKEDLDSDNLDRKVFDTTSLWYNYLLSQYPTLDKDGNGEISAQEIRAVTELTITGDDEITSLKDLYNFTCLKSLTLEEVKWTSLSGIQNASILNYVYFKGCTIGDYSALAGVKNLTYLYVYNVNDSELSILCNGIASAEFSKLNYLAVVGGGTSYINDTSYISSVSSTKSAKTIETLEPLNRLSSTTKKAVKYLSINNNNINEDLSYIADYTSLIYLRCEYNSITSLNGLDDMDSLVYLQASYNSIGNGSNSEDTSLASLSGKSELACVYLTNNSNLAYVAYLNNDSKIGYLYLAGCSKSMLASTIADVLGRTNGNYSLPVRWLSGTRYAISEEIDLINDELSTSYTVATVPYSVLESDLYGNTTITYLNLEGVQITNVELNELLASMPQLTYVTLMGCSNLTTLDFVSSTEITVTDSSGNSSTETSQVTGLIELDLRDTGVTNLTPLNVNAKSLCTLRVNCTEVVTEAKTFTYQDLDSSGNVVTKTATIVVGECAMDLSLIETTLNRLSGSQYWYTSHETGFCCDSSKCLMTLSKTTGLTSLYSYMFGLRFFDDTLSIDLSNNSNLKSIISSGWYFNVKLPTSISVVKVDQGFPFIISSGTSTVTSYIQCDTAFQVPETVWINFFGSLSNSSKIEYLMLGRSQSSSFSLSLFSYCNDANIITLQIGWNANSTASDQTVLNSLSGISYLAGSLKEFILYNCSVITDYSDLAKCTNLETISITKCILTDTSVFQNLTKLTSLTLDDNAIYDLSGLSNLSSLQTLSLKNNSIGEAGLKIISELKDTYGVLSKVYLSGNDSISDWSYVNKYSGWDSTTLSGW